MALLGFWGWSVFAAIFQPSKAVNPTDHDTDNDTDTVPALRAFVLCVPPLVYWDFNAF